jgi:glutamyl-tRNA synthetase
MPSVRVRFAPSPTGFLHVGGARTAIFNWLFARRHGGSFVLRVEDTDLGRSSEPMVRAILEGLDWLGLQADEGPFFQSRSRARHVEVARRLLAHGQAYRCFCDAAALKEARARAEKDGGSHSYPRTCRELDPDASAGRAEAGETFAVRFRVPEREVAWEDRVHGRTVFEHGVLEDFVLLRSDGTPTYQLSVVSDDLEMRITHVIRGDDHLSNTPKQLLIYRALDEPAPEFAHLPLILGEDRKRLSKRHGAVSVLEYRDRGYLPDAMFNFLALLGWSPGDDRQLLDRTELIEAFDLPGVGRSGAIFDLQKLEWMSGQYMMATPPERLGTLARPFLERATLWRPEFDDEQRAWLLELLNLLRPRVRTLEGFVTQGRPYLEPSDEIEYDAKAAKKHLKGEALVDDLQELERRLVALEHWQPDALERVLRSLAEERSLSAAKLIHPTRLAVTGRGASPGIFAVLDLLGRERSLRRLRRLIEQVERGAVP